MLRSDRDRRHRARYDAVRRDVFAEMDRQSTRWRLAWFVPFNVFVFGLLWLRGESWARAALQLGSLAAGILVATLFHPRGRTLGQPSPVPFYVGAIHYFVGLALTGSIASPLLPVALPIAVISAIVLEERRAKIVFGLFLGAGFLVLASISRTPWGALPAPLSQVNGTTSLEYVIVATCSVVFAVLSLLRIGLYVTDVYAEVALELAARREEIFEDGEDRSRSLRGRGRAARARGQEPARGHQGAFDALGTQQPRREGRGAPRRSWRRRPTGCRASSTAFWASRGASTI